jgi:dTDP-4-dehydrorhamnose reductase
MRDLELWGGHECTVNRIGDDLYDQTVRSGHHERLDDLGLFASLGIKALRYPVLWERVAPERPSDMDWRWSDQRLTRLRELGVRPIVGLVHHGAGPAYTGLLDPGFASGLARFGAAAAERYPWVEEWTPVNEPLTTARFSALYGLWSPHLRDECAFWSALLNQVEAVRAAMRAIREINPRARLVQTEDLGRTYATRAVAHQASFDNERRWMTWDLLTGRVVPGHPLWRRLADMGLESGLLSLAEAPCPPDVIGVNHYLTSDRFLDHRLPNYPPERHGGNQFLAFADVEAVRVLQPGPAGLEGSLREAWTRYRLPLAVTESHNGCTRDEQMRWLAEGWRTALSLRTHGVDVRALTAWSLLGAYDWDSLLTRTDGHYESGAFDTRTGVPRRTAVAGVIQDLARGAEPGHPVLANPGWWRRDVRLHYQPVMRSVDSPEPSRELRPARGSPAPLLVVGATGTLGKAFGRACQWRAIDYVLTDRSVLRLDDHGSLEQALELYRPWAVINAAGWVRVDDAEGEPEACMRANAHGATALAEACARRDIPLVSFSSDLVFDGELGRPYLEDDPPNPLNVYGRSKQALEQGVLQLGERQLVIRTAAFFSPFDRYNFAWAVAHALAGGREVAAASDLVVSPTYVPELVDTALDLLIDGEGGLWHLTNGAAVSWSEFGTLLAEALGMDGGLIRPDSHAAFGWRAPRPLYSPLATQRGALLSPLHRAIERFAASLHDAGFRPAANDLEPSAELAAL